MATIVALIGNAADNIKSTLTTQEFGSDYELLCTELSLQLIRFRLWGESVGIRMDDPDYSRTHIFTRPEIEDVVAQTITSIAHLLAEIEELRNKYDLKSQTSSRKGSFSFQASKSLTSSCPSSVVALRQRMEDNQKQKSFLNLAKWVCSDAKMFEEKVSKLKNLMGGLEGISKSAETTSIDVLRPPSYTAGESGDMPPPYTNTEPRQRTRTPRINTDIQSGHSRPVSVFSPLFIGEFSKHYIAFKHVLAASSINPIELHSRARDKLTRLSDIQFKELRTDVYDDLNRRQKCHDATGYLPEDQRYHPKRNVARKRLSALPNNRFLDLINDLVAEIEHRLGPGAELRSSTGTLFTIPKLASPLKSSSINVSPPSKNPLHLTQLSATTQSLGPKQTYIPLTPLVPSPSTHPSSISSETTTFQSFRVSPSATTSVLLPAAMEKYGISAPWQDYSLWIMYGPSHSLEMCLELDDRPLSIFKRLEKDGEGPMFMLRKNA
ncbi:hypothetical protein HYFRA_00000893 [Hymenoscyphus fraxineus]|uniref:Ras-associating domain-containing protein n=1 Tax=Hymenoscyphus fraxineus TaxID=746836 RepID=A0A9N9KQP4_9HELO|nr:hypothetical protein HYFRA_00000893 [Hymenoscyphus fraxineus]